MDYEKAREEIEKEIKQKQDILYYNVLGDYHKEVKARTDRVEALQTALHAIEFRLSVARKLDGIEQVIGEWQLKNSIELTLKQFQSLRDAIKKHFEEG